MPTDTRTHAPKPFSEPGTERFDEALDQTYQGVRGALTEVLISAKADPSRPQDIARRFGINKNLAWKISKIIAVPEPHSMISNLPGDTGMDRILSAFETGGASKESVHAARQAIAKFDRMVEMHVDDRSTLQLVLSSNAPHKVPQEHLHATRKMAFQGNSAIWGVQARVRMASFFLAPNAADPTRLDTASIGGLIDVRRLRADVSVPLFMRFAYNDDGSVRTDTKIEPICTSGEANNPLMLMQDFCSSPNPPFQPMTRGDATRYLLSPGPIGNYGRQTWVFGELVRDFASIYADEHNRVGEHAVPIQLPTEWLVCDLQVHRDLEFAMAPRPLVYSLVGTQLGPAEDSEYDRLPIAEEIQSTGHAPPALATPLMPEYPKIVDRVYKRLDWNPRDFHGFRFVMRYPPMPCSVVIQHDLATR
ncbi:MAG: hypothetical protein ACIAQF_04865 [Phycisphaerales bacterium JB065]